MKAVNKAMVFKSEATVTLDTENENGEIISSIRVAIIIGERIETIPQGVI